MRRGKLLDRELGIAAIAVLSAAGIFCLITYVLWLYASSIVLAVALAACPFALAAYWYTASNDYKDLLARNAALRGEKNAIARERDEYSAAVGYVARDREETIALWESALAAEKKLVTRLTAELEAEKRINRANMFDSKRLESANQKLGWNETELTNLRARCATYERRERERQGWQTLPQGYDLEAERFAATIANALRA